MRLAYFLLFTVFLIVVSTVSFKLARYAPMGVVVDARLQPVWDRWKHRVCYVSSGVDEVMCTAEELERGAKKLALPGEIQKLKNAEFSDDEIQKWIEGGSKEKK